ncbi:glutathione S-transferase T3-like [Oryza glaberrima]|uniref:glutathione S-transferase T3-like n=1 Tax=Oryza glaberrima TaxID=4538 RepID=UPI00023E2066|nr:glutathione S-transferase T3-like [Oryza glaberrima]
MATSTRPSARRRRVTASPTVAADPKRRYYTHEEDIRLVSAWLENSTDPVEGVNRKGETYWTKVTEVYNQTTPPDKQRDAACLKSHWHKTSRKVALFNGCYIQLRDNKVSGRSDEQLMEEALQLYISRSNGKHFKFVHWWRAVCDSPKWNVHAKSYGNGARKFTPDLNMNAAPTPQQRPMGVKRAKKAMGLTPEVAQATMEVSQHLKSLVDANVSQKGDVEAMKEFQQKLSDQRVEAANLNLLAAQENRRSKLIDQRSKGMEMFTQLLQVDTSLMEPWAKEAHMKAVTQLSAQLWGGGESPHVD